MSLYLLGLPTTGASFSTLTAAAGSWGAGSVGGPSGLSASRPCTASPTVPTLRSVSSAATSTSTASVGLPAGTVAGDVLVAAATSSNASYMPVAPAGWTLVRNGTSNLYTAGSVYYRVATGSEPSSYTFTGFTPNTWEGAVVLAAFSGVDTTTPVDVSGVQVAASQTNPATAPSVTTTVTGTLHVMAYMARNMQFSASYSASTPVGTSSVGTRTSNAATPQTIVAVVSRTQTAAGATGSFSSTLTNTSYWVGISLALRGTSGVDPTVTLSWTPSADTGVTGYTLARTPGGTTSVTGRTTATTTDTTTSAATGYTYALSAVAGPWTSDAVSVSVAAC